MLLTQTIFKYEEYYDAYHDYVFIEYKPRLREDRYSRLYKWRIAKHIKSGCMETKILNPYTYKAENSYLFYCILAIYSGDWR